MGNASLKWNNLCRCVINTDVNMLLELLVNDWMTIIKLYCLVESCNLNKCSRIPLIQQPWGQTDAGLSLGTYAGLLSYR
jgi:hypothetical protein